MRRASRGIVYGGDGAAGAPLCSRCPAQHAVAPGLPTPFQSKLQAPLPTTCCSFIFVLDGVVEVAAGSERVALHANDFAYVPAHLKHSITSADGAGLLLFERRYALKVGGGSRARARASAQQAEGYRWVNPSPGKHGAEHHSACAVAAPAAQGGAPRFVHGATQAQPVLPVPGEVFQLRKLLPQTAAYDFNVHVMDFLPGEYLNVRGEGLRI